MSPLARFVFIGATLTGLIGAIVGLIIGLFTYPPTAPFAVIELGVPAAIAGAALGLVIGSLFPAIQGVARSQRAP